MKKNLIKTNYIGSLLFFFLLFGASFANAALVFTAPNQDADGSYTLSWTGRGAYVILYEKVNGSWKSISGGQINSYAVSGKLEGSYDYKLDNYCQTGPSVPYLCESVLKTVTVGTAAPTISDVLNTSINEDSSKTISFTIGDLDTNVSLLNVSVSSSNSFIIPLSGLVLTGSNASRNLTITPRADASGTVEVTISVSDGAKTTSKKFNVYVISINDAPTISSIAAKSINEDSTTGAIAFTVNDIESGGSLTVSAASSNAALIPSSAIILAGSGVNRTVTVTPATNLSGSATITLTVSDGALTASTSFLLTVNGVNDAPTISNISDRTINEDSSTGVISFSVTDIDTASTSLSVTASSSNTSLIPSNNIALGGSGSARTIILNPAANAFGVSTITVTVSDGQLVATDTFIVTVNPVNDGPSISAISNVSINEGVASSGNLGFTISDLDTPVGNLTVSVVSSNTGLVSNASINLSGTGAARTISVGPTAHATGTATITVTVSDGSLTASRAFTFTVVDLPAQIFSSTTSTTTGSFSLSWDYAKETVKITESKNGGTEYPLPEYPGELPPSSSVSLNRNVSGVYKYTLYECLHSGSQSQGGPITTCTATSSKSVTVVLPAPIVNASLSATTINEGGSAVLTWSSTNSNNCSATNISGVTGTSGVATYLAPSVMSVNQTVSFVVTCTGGGGSASKTLNLNVSWINDAPVLSVPASVAGTEDNALYIPFTISDEETANTALTWVISSSDQTKVANSGFSVELTANRIRVVPVPDAYGNLTITVRVTDANGAYSQREIAITIAGVNDAPTIGHLADLTINQGASTGLISVPINDVDINNLNNLQVSASVISGSVGQASVSLGGTGSDRFITITPSSTYVGQSTIRVSVSDGSITVDDSFVLTVVDLPPTLFIENNNGQGSYTVAWKYGNQTVRLFESRNGVEYSDVYGSETGPSSSKSYTKTQDGNYNYRLYDCTHNQNGADCSSLSDTKSVNVSFPIPNVPSISLSESTSSTGEFTVSWGAVAHTNRYELLENDLPVSNVGGNPLFTSKQYLGGSAKSTGVYSYKVRACNATGCSGYSASATLYVAKPSTVTAFDAVMDVRTGVTNLSWSLPLSATKYEVQQQFNLGTWSATQTYVVRNATFPAVIQAGSYRYQVRACDTAGSYTYCSAWVVSNSVFIAVPTAPELTLDSTNTTGSLSIVWTNPGNASKYVLNENQVDLPYTITNTNYGPLVKANGSYSYKVKACNAVGCSDYSAVKSVDVAKVSTLGTVTAVLNQSTGITSVSWGVVAGAARYDVQALLDGTVNGGVVSVASPVATMPKISQLGSYSYKVKACAVAGNFTNCATAVTSNSVTPSVPADVPVISAPLNSVSGAYSVKWSSVSGADRYQVYENGVQVASVSDLSFAYTDANHKTTGLYSYKVRACMALCGPESNIVTVNVEYTQASSSSSGATGDAILAQPIVDPLNDYMGEDEYLGALTGTQSVGNDGSFNYTLPIGIPPGINGVQPNLSLSYSSARRNGLAGWGWTLMGLSAITRCSASLIRDGHTSGIQHDDQYAYCLDGQRLIEIGVDQYRTESESFLRIQKNNNYWQVTDNSGNVSRYGFNDDSRMDDDQNTAYVWYMDKQQDVSGNAWTVTYTKDAAAGIHYPQQIDYTQNPLLGTQHSIVLGYENRDDLLLKMIAGTKSLTNKRLKTIAVESYGKNVKTYTLEYQQQGQTYHGKSYLDPAKTSRLAKVTLCFANDTKCVEPVAFDWNTQNSADYMFQMSTQALLPDLTGDEAVKLMLDINGNGVLEPYVVENAHEWIQTEVGGHPYSKAVTYNKADVNGDGLDDVIKIGNELDVFLSNGTTINAQPTPGFTKALDQLVFYSAANYSVMEVQGDSWFVDSSNISYMLSYVDIDSDGYVDLVRQPTCEREIRVYCSFKSSPGDISVAFNDHGTGFLPFVTWATGWNQGLENQQLQFADINSDGAIDFISTAFLNFYETFDSYLGINNGRGRNGGAFVISQKFNTNAMPGMLGDFNGDGITDIARVPRSNYQTLSGADGAFSVSLGVGKVQDYGGGIDGFMPAHIALTGYEYSLSCGRDSKGYSLNNEVVDYCSRAVVDFNGDGLSDIVEWGRRDTRVCLNNPADSLENCGNNVGATTISAEGRVYLSKGADAAGNIVFAPPVQYENLGLIQQIGDDYHTSRESRSKLSGIYDYDNDGAPEDDYRLKNPVKSNRLEAIYEAHRSVSVTYEQLGSNTIYRTAGEATQDLDEYSAVSTPNTLKKRFGVQAVSISNGIGGFNRASYSYAGSRIHESGYGDLGFSTITKIETVEGNIPLKTITNFYQDANQQYNLAGHINRQQVYTSNSAGDSLQLLSDTRYQWKVRLYDDDVDTGYTSPHYFAYLYETSNHTWDMGGSEVSTSLTQNHAYSASSCTELVTSPSILTTASGGGDDVDYHADGVLLYTETATCDQSGSTSAVQISATENSDITSAGEARGLVQTNQAYAWVGSTISLADKDNYSARTQSFTYNSLGQLKSKTVEPNASAASGLKLTSTFAYNGYGSVSSITDTWDEATNSGLSVTSRVTTINESINSTGVRTLVVTKPQALSETTVFEPIWGQPHQQTDANGLVTTTDYDELGRPSLVSYADDTSTQLDYRSCAANDFPYNSHCAWYAQSKTTGSSAQRTYYDGLGRAVGSRTSGLDGRAVYTVQSYNARGSVAQATAPFFYGEVRNATVNGYDALGRITDITYPDDAVEHRTYSGLTQSITNRLNQTQYRYLNGAGWVVQSVDNNNTPVDFTYWPFGELHTTKVNNDDATLVTMEYDTLGRKTSLTDPNTGTITYTYNALDLLATQIDAKGQRTCYKYDALGRQTGRVDLASTNCTGTYTQQWAYDTQLHGKGLLASLTGVNTDGSSYSESYTYTNYSLPQITTSTFGGSNYAVTQYYDGFNRPLGVKYPTGYVAANGYNEYGQLAQVNDSTGATLWAANDSDSLGNVTQFTLGNGVVTNQTFNPDTGLIHSVNASKGSLVIQNQIYNFDSLGNLTAREDAKRGVTQSFCYDGLNRLKAARFDGCSAASNDYTYDNLGNLTHKADAGGSSFNLDYTGQGQAVNNAGPHAVTAANGWSYTYDASGNLTQATKAGESPKNVVYSAFNTPTSITQGSNFSTLVYGPNQDRIKHSDSNGRVTKYVGGIYEEVTKGGVTQKLHYVGDFAIFVQTDGVTPTSHHEYLHRDHIGSVVAISNEAANSASDIQWQANGAWGERRFEQWNGPQDLDFVPTSTAHGFTDHEQLDAVGLIHMNGRVYDPELGRFLSADPHVQAPYNTQSYNRYAYVFNNPLSFTDPSGYEANDQYSNVVEVRCGVDGISTENCPKDDTEPVPGVRIPKYQTAHSGNVTLIGADGFYFLSHNLQSLSPAARDWNSGSFFEKAWPFSEYNARQKGVEIGLTNDVNAAHSGQQFFSDTELGLMGYLGSGGGAGIGALRFSMASTLVLEGYQARSSILVRQLSYSIPDQRALFQRAVTALPGQVRHHVIPLEALKRLPELMRKAAEGGFNINGKNNGIALAKELHGVAGHRGYNNAVITELARINPRLTPAQTAARVQEMADVLIDAMNKGDFYPLY